MGLKKFFIIGVMSIAFLSVPKTSHAFLESILCPNAGAAAAASAALVSALTSVPTFDSTAAIINGATASATGANATKECGGLDSLIQFLINQIMQTMLENTIDWVNSGFEGKPLFVQDPQHFFETVGDNIVGQYLDANGLDWLCGDFKLQIKLGLAVRYDQVTRKTYTCKLSDLNNNFQKVVNDINGSSLSDFVNIDVNTNPTSASVAPTSNAGKKDDGGLSALQKVVMTNDNPDTAFLNAQSSLNLAIGKKQVASEKELNWGKGFLSLKDSSGKTTTPGNVINDQLNNAFAATGIHLAQADEFDELFSALANQLLIKVKSAVFK